MKAQSAFIGTDGAVELHPETAIHPDIPGIVHPRHPEHELPLRLDEALHDPRRNIFGMFFQHIHQRIQYFLDRLVKFRLVRIAFDNPPIQFLTVLSRRGSHVILPLMRFSSEHCESVRLVSLYRIFWILYTVFECNFQLNYNNALSCCHRAAPIPSSFIFRSTP